MRGVNAINISINQLADFSNGTDGKKRGIIRQQKFPNPLKVFWYQLAKSRIRKSIANRGDLEPILLGIEELKSRTLVKKREINDRNVSLEAMQKFIELKLPTILNKIDYEIVKSPKIKSIYIKGVEVIISPDLIIKASINGNVHLGAIKIHVAKHNHFDRKQQGYVATGLYKYLETVIATNDEIVIPELCLSIDIFGGCIVSSSWEIESKLSDMEIICEEVKKMWLTA